MIETKRLILRQWTKDDFAPFAELNADEEVMEYFPAPLSTEESNKFAKKTIDIIESKGWGLWAVELKESGCFIGFVGLHAGLTGFFFHLVLRLARDSQKNTGEKAMLQKPLMLLLNMHSRSWNLMK